MPCSRSPKSPESGDDEPHVVQLAVERGGDDGHVGMLGLDPRDALRGSDDAHERDRGRFRVRLHVGDRGAARSARREHGVEHERPATFHPRELRVVVARLERLFVAFQAEVADDRVGIEVRDGVEESEPGTEHGDGDERLGDAHGLRLLHRRLDRDALGRGGPCVASITRSHPSRRVRVRNSAGSVPRSRSRERRSSASGWSSTVIDIEANPSPVHTRRALLTPALPGGHDGPS